MLAVMAITIHSILIQIARRCNGEGVSRVVLQDSTKLDDAAALAYSGVKVGKAGIEITSISRERMFEAVAKRLGLADAENAQRTSRWRLSAANWK